MPTLHRLRMPMRGHDVRGRVSCPVIDATRFAKGDLSNG